MTIADLIDFLRLLPSDAEPVGWELTYDGCGCYTLTTTVRFAVPPGHPPPHPGRPRPLTAGSP